MTKTKKQLQAIVNMLSNHVLSKLTSIDGRLDRHGEVLDVILDEMKGLKSAQDVMCQRLLLVTSSEEGE